MTAAAGPTTPISAAEAVTLDGLFRERVARTPEAIAYRDYNQQHANWRDYTWAQSIGRSRAGRLLSSATA